MANLARLLIAILLLSLAPAAGAQSFPKFDDSGVIDAAHVLSAEQRQALSQKLIAQKKASGRSLVVATIADLQGYDISDYGYRLGRAWGVGDKNDTGALLIVAPAERKVRIEVGYGLEGILTDAISARTIRNVITPRFKAGDLPGGIAAGVDALSAQLALPPDEARKQAALAEKEQRERAERSDNGGTVMIVFWVMVLLVFVVLPMLRGGRGGRRYGRGGGVPPVIIWGPGMGGSNWGSGGGSGWGSGGGGGWGGGGGGFSGGGDFGGGGASGDW